MAPIELELPELDGKTSKMYRGGKICLDIHFSPLWAKNTPKYGIVHALAIAVTIFPFNFKKLNERLTNKD
jgi:ufm1-conjugating enzyme 1